MPNELSPDNTLMETGSKPTKTYKDCGYSESIDSAFEILQEMHLELSQMADSKANIMITVSSILLTLAIAKIEQGVLVYPAIAFIVFTVPALIFSILCVMPSSIPPVDVENRHKPGAPYNPLFFMHYSQVPMKEFEKDIESVLTSPESLYTCMSRDVYIAGKVLREKKYRLLRWSYMSLLSGIFFGCLGLIYELLTSI